MFCIRCGAQLQESQGFCPACGKAVGPEPTMPAEHRVAGHVRLLGILWLAISVLRLIPGVVLLCMFGHGMYCPLLRGVPGFVNALLQVAGVLLLAAAVIGIVTGWGLLERRPWARMLAIVWGSFNLISIPFGTALGIYTLWVLLPAKSEQEYAQIAKPA